MRHTGAVAGNGAPRGGTADDRFAGAPIPRPRFADDDGSADAGLTAALAAYAAGSTDRDPVLAQLTGVRLLVPVVAVLDTLAEPQQGDGGLAQEKDSHMATVTLTNPDGRRGLLAFTSTAALTAWRADARPVAAAAGQVARAALEERADAVLLDIAGPVPFPVEGYPLAVLASGQGYQPAYANPAIATAVLAALAPLPGPPRARLLPGDAHGADVALELDLAGATLAQVSEALAAQPALAELCPRGVAVLR